MPTTTVSGSLKVDSTMSTTGNLQVSGTSKLDSSLTVNDIIKTEDLVVTGTSKLDSSLTVNDVVKAEDLVVTGTAKISGDINLSGKLLFDPSSNLGLGFKSGLGTSPDIFTLGKLGNPPPAINPCILPSMDPWFSMPLRIQLFDPTNNVALTMGSDAVQSSIDALGNGGLLVNYYCGKNIYLGTGSGSGGAAGTLGSNVYVGDQLFARKNVQIGNPGPNPIDANVSLNLFLNGTTSGLKLWSGAIPTVKLIHDNYDQFMVMGNGKTSIGVNATAGATPYKTLTVNGDASFANYGAADGANAFEILGNSQIPTNRGISLDNNSNVTFFVNSTSAIGSFKFKNGTGITYDLMELDVLGKLSTIAYGNDAIEIKNFGSGKVIFTVKSNGQTFIGDKAPLPSGPHGNAKLAVDGKILAREIFVSIHNSVWPDYVFENNYKLTPLNEVETYYTQNKHLKGVPSAKEITENGINTAEMFSILLQKVEDLTLYSVEQNKRIEKLEKEKAELKEYLKKLDK